MNMTNEIRENIMDDIALTIEAKPNHEFGEIDKADYEMIHGVDITMTDFALMVADAIKEMARIDNLFAEFTSKRMA